MEFVHELRKRNSTLFFFGLICLFFSLICLLLAQTTDTYVFGVNAWYKPFKFAFSTFLYAWAMAWYCGYLRYFKVRYFNWTVIVLLGFEILYIAFQAGRGELSHYNISSPTYAFLYSLMGVAASLVTLYTGYVGLLFFRHPYPNLPNYYLWAIRLSMLIFVIFSFEGFAMGARLNHSVGALNDNSDWIIVGWSRTVGDLRIAHFIGMHALQVLPLLAYYVFKNTKLTLLAALLYGLLALAVFIQAFQGKPFLAQ